MAVIVEMEEVATGKRRMMYSADARELAAIGEWIPATPRTAGVLGGARVAEATQKREEDMGMGDIAMRNQDEAAERRRVANAAVSPVAPEVAADGQRGGGAQFPDGADTPNPEPPTVAPETASAAPAADPLAEAMAQMVPVEDVPAAASSEPVEGIEDLLA